MEYEARDLHQISDSQTHKVNTHVHLNTLTIRHIPFLILLLTFAGSQLAIAGEVMLTIARGNTDPLTIKEYDLDMLDELPQTTVRTGNDFIDGVADFTGPLARVVLEDAGIEDTDVIKLIAANEYFIEVPVSDFEEYDVILATRQSGVLFSRRDRGPIWLIYPMAEFSELRDSTYNARLIWQLVRMEVTEH